MKLLLAGGGTGGHLFPAVALAERLMEVDSESQVLFVGTERGLEARILPQLGWRLKTIDIRGLIGQGWKRKVMLMPMLVRSIMQSIRILTEFKPDVIVGVGGYASAPVLLAATLTGRHYLIHEQNATPGLTNRLLGHWAVRICVSHQSTESAFPRQRTVVTGNPLRRGFSDCPQLPDGPPLLLVFGGSQGARPINDALIAALSTLTTEQPQLKIIHQTGEDDCCRVRAAYQVNGRNGDEVTPFITDMARAYAAATLIVCRAGATTIAELTAAGRPAIMIPFPAAAADHQTVNAAMLAQKGAGLLLSQRKLTGATLSKLVDDLLHDRRRLETMAAAARSLGRPDATDALLRECQSLVEG